MFKPVNARLAVDTHFKCLNVPRKHLRHMFPPKSSLSRLSDQGLMQPRNSLTRQLKGLYLSVDLFDPFRHQDSDLTKQKILLMQRNVDLKFVSRKPRLHLALLIRALRLWLLNLQHLLQASSEVQLSRAITWVKHQLPRTAKLLKLPPGQHFLIEWPHRLQFQRQFHLIKSHFTIPRWYLRAKTYRILQPFCPLYWPWHPISHLGKISRQSILTWSRPGIFAKSTEKRGLLIHLSTLFSSESSRIRSQDLFGDSLFSINMSISRNFMLPWIKAMITMKSLKTLQVALRLLERIMQRHGVRFYLSLIGLVRLMLGWLWYSPFTPIEGLNWPFTVVESLISFVLCRVRRLLLSTLILRREIGMRAIRSGWTIQMSYIFLFYHNFLVSRLLISLQRLALSVLHIHASCQAKSEQRLFARTGIWAIVTRIRVRMVTSTTCVASVVASTEPETMKIVMPNSE